MQDILDFIDHVYGPEAVHEAWREFSLWDEDAPPLDVTTPHRQLFVSWFVHRWIPGAAGDTAISGPNLQSSPPSAVFMERQSGQLSASRRLYLQTCLATPYSFHEILKGSAEQGFELRDLLSGHVCAACHNTHSYPVQLRPTDIVYGQCVQVGELSQLEACSPLAIPARYKKELAERCRAHVPFEHLSAKQRHRRDLKLRAVYFDVAGALLGGPDDVSLLRAV